MTMERPVHRVRTDCRACGGSRLARFLDLGEVALANAFLRSEAEFEGERRFPLSVHLCEDCGLAQLVDVIDPEVLFRNYLYVTGTSDTIAAHNEEYASTVVDLLGLGADDLVCEVASNDGSLLKRFQRLGVRTLGIEPATNIAEQARADGVETLNEFFDLAAARTAIESHGRARAVIGNNVLAHVDTPVEFLAAAKAMLADDGLVVIEVPELREFVERLEYDTVYHEHLSYFSVTALMRVCEEAGLRIVRVDRKPVHGGTVRMYATHVERQPDHAADVRAIADRERGDGLTTLEGLSAFGRAVERNREALLALLRGIQGRGHTLAAYGAPAKGNTLLNYCDIRTDLLPYTVDKSPLKVGLWTPGQHIPVLPVETLMERKPDYVLILAWNFAAEIARQQSAWAEAGGRFLLPLPEPREMAR